VTGASSGIGRAIAEAYLAEGAAVLITHRDSAERAREVSDLVLQADLATRDACERLVAEARSELGRIDVWVNNAGADVLTGEAASWEWELKLDLLLAVDLKGTIACSYAIGEVMRGQERGGAIINMSWDHVLSGMPGRNPELFAAVKGGVLAFSKSLARTVAPRVRVNVIAPGWIETSFASNMSAGRRLEVAEAAPLQRWGTPDDVAGAAIFLASPAAAFLTGQTILVGGGVVM